MQASHASSRSSRRRARSLEMVESTPTPRSRATICLDGEDFYKVLHNYVEGMKVFHDWLCAGNKIVDASPFFGPGVEIARTREGIFTMVYEFEGKSLEVPIQGINLYLRGFSNDHGKFEFDFGDAKFTHDKLCAILNIGVNYHDLLDEGLERSRTGVWPLRDAVRELCNYSGGPAAAIARFVGTIAIYTSEAGRAGPIHSFMCRSIVDQSLSRLGKGKGLVIWIRKYSALCFELMDNINRLHDGKAPRPIRTFGLNITLEDLAIGLRVCYREAFTEGVFKIEPPEGQAEGARGQGLMARKIRKGLSTSAASECSYIIKCSANIEKGYGTPLVSSYTVKFTMCQIVKRTSIQIAETPRKALLVTESPRKALQIAASPCKALLVPEFPCKALQIAESSCKALLVTESPRKTLQIAESHCKALLVPEFPRKALQIAESPRKALQIAASPCKALLVPEFPCKALQIAESSCKALLVTESPRKALQIAESHCKALLVPEFPRKALQIAELPRKALQTLPSIVKPNPTIENGYRLKSSCSVRCDLNQIGQMETFQRAKPSFGVNWSLSLMERLSGQKAVTSSEVNRPCMFGFTTKSRLKTCVDLSTERTNLGPGKIIGKLTKLGSTTVHENEWANNRRPVSRTRFSINLLQSSLSSSFPHQNVRQCLSRALRFLH